MRSPVDASRFWQELSIGCRREDQRRSIQLARRALTLYAGSSSLKFALFEHAGAALECAGGGEMSRIMSGEIEAIGTQPRFRAIDAAGRNLEDRMRHDGATLDHESLLADLLS
ncbi:MAG: hypothetical protein ACREV7_19055 [Steroidobacteraceae bacterium]